MGMSASDNDASLFGFSIDIKRYNPEGLIGVKYRLRC